MQATRPREVDIDAMSATFLRASPLYRETEALDRLREREYARLDGAGHVYLDYTGGGLYAQSQIDAHADVLKRDVLGNPHSTNPTSAASTVAVERAKAAVLRFFKADANEYLVIFTANATGALKTVAEAYPFEKDGQLLLTFYNHNSVIGMREYARTAGAATSYVPSTLPDMRIDEPHLNAALAGITAGSKSLFAYPAQSNFSGVQHDLAWIAKAQAAGWHVLLDAAAFVPTNALDLSSVHPDFVALSFYKMFGYPTGIGCLLGPSVLFLAVKAICGN